MTSHSTGRAVNRGAISRRSPSDDRVAQPQPQPKRTRHGRRASESSRVETAQSAPTAFIGLALGAFVVVAMTIGSAVLTLASSAAAIGVSVLSPMAGLVALTFLAPIARPLVIPPPGFFVAVAAAIVFGLIVRLPIERPKLRPPSLEVILLGVFFGYAMTHMVAGVLDGASGATGRDVQSLFMRLLENLVAFGVAYVVLRDRSPNPVLAALLLGAGVAAVVGLSQWFEADDAFATLIIRPDPSGRISGVFGNTNYFGAYLGAMVALASALAVHARSRRMKLLLTAFVLLFAVTLVLTQSRGALVTLVAGLVTVAFVYSPLRGILVAAVLGFIGLLAYPIFSAWRFGDGDTGLTTAAGRTDAWFDGFESFASSPLLGIGLGRFEQESTGGIAPHNWYVQVLAELGIVGIGVWALFIGAVIVALRGRPRPARAVGYSVLVTWLVAGLTMSPPGLFQFSGPVLVAIAAAVVAVWPAEGRDGKTATARRPGEPGAAAVALGSTRHPASGRRRRA